MSADRPIRVLLVEDNDGSAADYVRILRAEKYLVERASALSDAIALSGTFNPDVAILDLQIPSEPGRVDEDIEHGMRAIDEMTRARPFGPLIVLSAHSGNRELMRRVYERAPGVRFVFKDAEDIERELSKALAVALERPAYKMSKTVAEFRAMVDKNLPEEDYRQFIHRNWSVILGPEYRDCESPYEVTRGGKIDLLAIRHDGFPDLWELKLPEDPLFKPYGQWLHHSLECAKAVGQLMEYVDFARKEPRWGLRDYDARRGVTMELHRPRGFVVIGRYERPEDRERLRLENSFLAGITVMTYDDLIERAEQLLSFLQQYRNGQV